MMNNQISSNKVLLVLLFFALIVPCFSQTEDYKYLKKVDWIFSDKDFEILINEEAIEIPKQIEQPKDKAYEIKVVSPDRTEKHLSKISYQASTEKDKFLIRKAEALYPKDLEIVRFQPVANDESPYWWSNSGDEFRIARIVSTRAIQYYQKLSQALREKTKFEISKYDFYEMNQTDFGYSATIKHYDIYKTDDEEFKNVDVADLKLEWQQKCFSGCHINFSRRKIVVFNISAKPIAMFLGDEKYSILVVDE